MPDLGRSSTAAQTEEAGPDTDSTASKRVFIDQGRKLRYLIRTRGDRRATRPLPDDGKRAVRSSGNTAPPRVKNQATLAKALAVDDATVSRWANDQARVPADALAEICRIFEIDELAFRTLRFSAFCAACEAPIASEPVPAQPLGLAPQVWHRLVHEALSDHVWIVLSDPYVGSGLDPVSSRHARVLPESSAASPIVEVAADKFFWVEVSSPRNPNGSPRWGGWHILLFNRDLERGSFKCLLPRFESHSAFGKVVLPTNSRAVIIPRRPVLNHDRGDFGEFEMIVLAVKDDPPIDIMDALASDGTSGAMLDIALQALGKWVDMTERRATAELAKVRYRLVEKQSVKGNQQINAT